MLCASSAAALRSTWRLVNIKDGSLSSATRPGYRVASPGRLYETTIEDTPTASLGIDVRNCASIRVVAWSAAIFLIVAMCDTKECGLTVLLANPSLAEGSSVEDEAVFFLRVSGATGDRAQLFCGVTE